MKFIWTPIKCVPIVWMYVFSFHCLLVAGSNLRRSVGRFVHSFVSLSLIVRACLKYLEGNNSHLLRKNKQAARLLLFVTVVRVFLILCVWSVLFYFVIAWSSFVRLLALLTTKFEHCCFVFFFLHFGQIYSILAIHTGNSTASVHFKVERISIATNSMKSPKCSRLALRFQLWFFAISIRTIRFAFELSNQLERNKLPHFCSSFFIPSSKTNFLFVTSMLRIVGYMQIECQFSSAYDFVAVWLCV